MPAVSLVARSGILLLNDPTCPTRAGYRLYAVFATDGYVSMRAY